MSDRTATSCLTPELIAAYCSGRLTEDQEMAAERHFGACDACTETARAFRTFESTWKQWTARSHGDAYWRMQLERAVATAERATTNAGWRQRLGRWRERFGAAAEGAVRVVMDEAGRASHIVTEGLDMLLVPGATMRFAPAPAGVVRTRGAVGTGGVAGGAACAGRFLAKVSAIGRPGVHITVGAASRAVRTRGAPSGCGEVVVRLDEAPHGRPAPLVLLVPTRTVAEALVAEPVRESGGRLVARFENLEPGDYFVVFEPTGD
jgi:hypothetical protein